MSDVKSRRIWSLSTGKLIDECDVEDTADSVMHRRLPHKDDIRVELTLKNALALFERHGLDVSEIFSQPRVCQEASGRMFEGATLRPGWSLDLTTADPQTGKKWDLSEPSVQNRARQLVRTTKPYCIVGSPPCTPFSPLQDKPRETRSEEDGGGAQARQGAHSVLLRNLRDAAPGEAPLYS